MAVSLCIHINIQYVWSMQELVRTQNLMLQCQDILAQAFLPCALHGRKGHVCVWAGKSSYLKVEGLQVSVTLCITCSGVVVCRSPLSVTFACGSAMQGPKSVCVLQSFQFMHSRSYMLQGLGERQSPLRVSSNGEKYVEFARKGGLSAFCSAEMGLVHLLLLLLPPLTATDMAGATMKGTWQIMGAMWADLYRPYQKIRV